MGPPLPERLAVAEHGTRVEFVGLAFDQYDAKTTVASLLAASQSGSARYLVTPNVDHVVRLHRQSGLHGLVAQAYARAEWCVCDSRILAGLCRLKGQNMTVAPGSDITRVLLDRLLKDSDDRMIAVVGMEADEFGALASKYVPLNLYHVCAPYGLATDADARSAICGALRNLNAPIVLLAVGAPQQELIALEFVALPGARGVLLCIGASLEFLVKPHRRAPRWLQRVGLEWAFRLIQDPRRLWRRYLYDGPAIFPIAFASTPKLMGRGASGTTDQLERSSHQDESDVIDRQA